MLTVSDCDRVWRAIRSSRPGMTVDDVALVSEVEEDAVQDYMTYLKLEGFLAPFGREQFKATMMAREIRTTPYPASLHPGKRVSLHVFLDPTSKRIAGVSEYPAGGFDKLKKLLGAGKRRPKVKRRSCRDLMWASVRELREFSQSQLVELSGCRASNVTDYVRLLVKHGYAEKVGKNAANQAVYKLVKDAGPERPETPELTTKRPGLHRRAARSRRVEG